MRYMRYNLALADSQAEDDIDRLFNQLQRIEPPEELIVRILSHIGSLPTPAMALAKRRRTAQGGQADVELDTPVVHNQRREPS